MFRALALILLASLSVPAFAPGKWRRNRNRQPETGPGRGAADVVWRASQGRNRVAQQGYSRSCGECRGIFCGEPQVFACTPAPLARIGEPGVGIAAADPRVERKDVPAEFGVDYGREVFAWIEKNYSLAPIESSRGLARLYLPRRNGQGDVVDLH